MLYSGSRYEVTKSGKVGVVGSCRRFRRKYREAQEGKAVGRGEGDTDRVSVLWALDFHAFRVCLYLRQSDYLVWVGSGQRGGSLF